MLSYFPKTYRNKSIWAFLISLLICSIIFFSRVLPLVWLIFVFIEVIGFFAFLHILSKRWRNIGDKLFIRKVFIYSFFIRLIWVVFSFFFYKHYTGVPFEFLAGDSIMYHDAAKSVIHHGYGNLTSGLWGLDLSDRGFPFYLSMIYYLFGDHIIIPRIINAAISAWTVILIYHLSKRNFGVVIGKMSAVIMMLMPNLIYYCGIHLKETVMVFLVVVFIERADFLMRGKINLGSLLLLAGLGSVLFFFRTVLLASVLFALMSMVLFIRRPGSNWIQRSIIVTWIMITVWFTFSYRIQAEFEALIDNIDVQSQNMEFRAARESGNKLATYGSTIIFAPVMFVAPFPTYVNIETQKNQTLISGGYIIKNILAFFIVIAIITIVRKKLVRKYILLLSFLLAYLSILAQSSFALSERFHLPALPFLIILAAYGITQVNQKNQKLFIPYLVIIVVAIIAWNAFKLAGRGYI
jgi:hypothetical protein